MPSEGSGGLGYQAQWGIQRAEFESDLAASSLPVSVTASLTLCFKPLQLPIPHSLELFGPWFPCVHDGNGGGGGLVTFGLWFIGGPKSGYGQPQQPPGLAACPLLPLGRWASICGESPLGCFLGVVMLHALGQSSCRGQRGSSVGGEFQPCTDLFWGPGKPLGLMSQCVQWGAGPQEGKLKLFRAQGRWEAGGADGADGGPQRRVGFPSRPGCFDPRVPSDEQTPQAASSAGGRWAQHCSKICIFKGLVPSVHSPDS